MVTIELKRSPELRHHVLQGIAWLAESAGGANTTALSYAAFEFRLAIERIGLQYWIQLMPQKIEEKDLRDLRKFKRIEKRIYDLAGHQQEIDKHFEFSRVLLKLLKIEEQLPTPKLSLLSKYWAECSELCHIAWSLNSNDAQLAADSHAFLTTIGAFLAEQVNGLVACAWLRVADPDFDLLRKKFIAGQASAEDVQSYLEKVGIWAVIKYNDGRPNEFMGEAIPPASKKETP
jgi:hypothetical protein